MREKSDDHRGSLPVRDLPSHPDPHPWYSRMARGRPLLREPGSGVWVAAGAHAVEEVLTSGLCHTRPPGERVPAAIRASAMNSLFSRLVRLRDGPAHDTMKAAIVAAMDTLDLRQVRDLGRACATDLQRELGPPHSAPAIGRFVRRLPVAVLAHLLGVAEASHAGLTTWLADYGAASAAAATGIPEPDETLLDRGHHAAQALFELMEGLASDAERPGPLLTALLAQAPAAGSGEREDTIANAIGLLIQGSTSTASLIGSSLLALARHPRVRTEVTANRALLRELVQEVLRWDPATCNTLRFVVRDGLLGGRRVSAGDVVVIAIAAANRDPALNPDPDAFELTRHQRRYLEFGTGPHACPAHALAPAIAETALDHLLAFDLPLEELASTVSYAPSGFIRAPVW